MTAPTGYMRGSEMLLKMDTSGGTGGPTYTTIGGITAQSMKIDEEIVDVTNQSSSGKWRELIGGAGIKKMSLSGSGVLVAGATYSALLTAKLTSAIQLWQIIVPGVGTFAGSYFLSSLDMKGPHDKEITFDISVESAGAITFTAAS